MIRITHTTGREFPFAPTLRDINLVAADAGVPPDAVVEIHKQTYWLVIFFWATIHANTQSLELGDGS